MDKYVTRTVDSRKRKTTDEKYADSSDLKVVKGSETAIFEFIQKKGDLFSCPERDALAHCVSADFRMGKGIAVLFKQKFGGVQELKDQYRRPGGVAVLQRGSRFVYFLVTKEKVYEKPTYPVLRSSLEAMKKHCVDNGVERVAMPRIGCGLDGLQWPKVADMIQQVFADTGLTITVYTL